MYLSLTKKKHKPMKECIFCQISNNEIESFRVYEDEHCFVILDKYPLSKGHVLVIPHTHQEFCNDLGTETQAHLMKVVHKINGAVLNSKLNCLASNILLNNGKASGQHIQHVHWHIIPRYKYDTAKLIANSLLRFLNPFNYIAYKNRQLSIQNKIINAISQIDS